MSSALCSLPSTTSDASRPSRRGPTEACKGYIHAHAHAHAHARGAQTLRDWPHVLHLTTYISTSYISRPTSLRPTSCISRPTSHVLYLYILHLTSYISTSYISTPTSCISRPHPASYVLHLYSYLVHLTSTSRILRPTYLLPPRASHVHIPHPILQSIRATSYIST